MLRSNGWPAQHDEKAAREASADAQREDLALRAEGKRLLEATRSPAEEYAATLDRLNALLRAGAIDQETFNRAVGSAQSDLAAAQRRLLDASRAWQDGMRRGLLDYARAATDAAATAEEATTRAFRGMEDALVAFVTTGKVDFASLADSIVADLARIAIRQTIAGPLAAALGSLFQGGSAGVSGGGGIGSLSASVAHAGGVVGHDALATRRLDAALFLSAPRFHQGGMIGPGEVPAILQRGERVLSREETRRYDAKGSGGPVTINVTIQTPSPTAFNASKAQIASELTRAVRAGMRGL